MTTIILGDSRLKGLVATFQDENCVLHIKSGSKIKDHTSFVKRLRHKSLKERKLFIVCVGINNIPDNLKDCSNDARDEYFTEIVRQFISLAKVIKRKHEGSKTVIATIPPKDVLKSVTKYPSKSELTPREVTSKHQRSFEQFVTEVNDLFISEFNKKHTGKHLAFHSQLRTHRGSGASRKSCPKSKTSQYYYHKLSDGLHPGEELLQVWIKKITDLRRELQF